MTVIRCNAIEATIENWEWRCADPDLLARLRAVPWPSYLPELPAIEQELSRIAGAEIVQHVPPANIATPGSPPIY